MGVCQESPFFTIASKFVDGVIHNIIIIQLENIAEHSARLGQ